MKIITKHGILLIGSVIISASASVGAQEFSPQLTEYGQPDFRGVWNFSNKTPLERPEHFGEQEFLSDEELADILQSRQDRVAATAAREAATSERILTTENARSVEAVNNFWFESDALGENGRTSLVIYPRDGRIPDVVPGTRVQRSDANGVREIPGDRPVRYTHGGIGRDGPEDRGLSERCMVFNSGPPMFSGPYNNNIQIFQNRDHVVILTEMGFDARIVPLEKTEHVDPAITLWSGDSRGYFEGNTLVVESRNFTDAIASIGMRQVAYGSAKNRLLIERFTPTAEGSLEYEVTIIDPDTFQDRIVILMPMTRVDEQLFEYACHAGNYALRNILRGARAEGI
ncbi:MAG: hypothetical protein DHS20C12_22550 [Pseudohongiella sp.]|nr:MAG: hypothetical protein DHS20C12_22550 [Pseudohongiella sp.]